MVSENDVRGIALSLPGTTEKPSYGTPGFRVRDKLFARIREERDMLLVWVAGEGEKRGLLAAEPGKFFTTPHYDGHPTVLVRLAAVDAEEVRELLTDSWRLRAPARLVAQFDAEA
ncbi:MmcQ/YjbR family DNA-binding protein [Actinophytocola glycyrrhizae]|uniref:MmcQ/YjbR family DNA-binding protein n=1 Tax=Actinophytocola glycyrrhizae TaxID=2044873 RepID=A0ABV9RXK7_9PSEU